MEPQPQPRPPAGDRSERRRRNRPALSCIQCRSRKIRCDRSEPCGSCIRSKIVNCVYEEARRAKPHIWRLSPDPVARSSAEIGGATFPVSFLSTGTTPPPSLPGGSSPSGATSHATDPSSDGIGATAALLAERVRQLEQQLADALKRQGPSGDPGHASTASPCQGVRVKTRYFGRSHWMNGTKFFPLITSLADKLETEKHTEHYQAMQKCKNLARSIKSKRVPAQFTFQVGKNIPPEATARELVKAYHRTFETVYRILHVPSFWRQYDKYWAKPDSASQAFVVQLQLCMAIGTCFQDNSASLRQLACQWIYEAQFWLVLPPEKTRMTLAGLQTRCLLHLAREACGVGGDLTWMSAGALVRTAMFMGLHRDPDKLPKMSSLKAELRRRLWATVMELALQSSLDSGGPPLISLSDYDTKAPSNFDDEQLTDDDQSAAVPRDPSMFSQTTVQITLLRSFATRLAIARYVNSFDSPVSYDETLRWNGELSKACRVLSAALHLAYDPAGVLPRRLSLFQLRLPEHMVHRFFLVLNQPWLSLAQDNPAYYFSRKMCVDTSFTLLRGALASPAGDSGVADPSNDFARLSTAGAGPFRTVPLQATLCLSLELMWQGFEDQAFRQSLRLEQQLDQPGHAAGADVDSSIVIGSGAGSAAAPRAELSEALNQVVGYMERRIRAGETNVKGNLFISGILAHMEALQRGLPDPDIEAVVLDSARERLRHCWHLLKELAGGRDTPAGLSAESPAEQSEQTGDAMLATGLVEDIPFWFGPGGDGDWDDFAHMEGWNFNFNFGNVDVQATD